MDRSKVLLLGTLVPKQGYISGISRLAYPGVHQIDYYDLPIPGELIDRIALELDMQKVGDDLCTAMNTEMKLNAQSK